MTLAEQLSERPPGFVAASGLIDRIDQVLEGGFSRIQRDQRDGLAHVASSLANTPLGEPLQRALDAFSRSEFLIRHFYILAASRSAILGAQYDALQDQLRSVLNRPANETNTQLVTPEPVADPESLSSVQQWLMELAVAGFRNLDESHITPFEATLERMQSKPELTGLSSLLTGFTSELLHAIPMDRHESLPVARWGDLWGAAMIRTQSRESSSAESTVSGDFFPVGVDVRMHDNFVSASVYGLLRTNGVHQTVRIVMNSYKVDLILGPEIWDLFGEVGDLVLQAIESKKSLKIEQAQLSPTGGLTLKAPPALGTSWDLLELAPEFRSLPPLSPSIRHPVHLAELVVLPIDCGIPIAVEHIPNGYEIEAKQLKTAKQIVGLLRFDGDWLLQPLGVHNGKETYIAGEGMAKARAKLKSRTLPTLRERSGKLLRS